MNTIKSLFHAECGTTNPLLELSHFYTHDKTFVTQDGLLNPSSTHLSDIDSNTTIDELVNEYHRQPISPNTFHLKSLLPDSHISDKQESEWTEQFLSSYSNHTPSNSVNLQSVSPSQLEETYILPLTSFHLHPNPNSFGQQPYPTNPEFNNDTVTATNNILSFLRENQFAANVECRSFADDKNSSNDREDHTHNTTNLIVVNNQSSLSRLDQSNDRVDNFNEYKFVETNPFLDCVNPYGEGLKRLEVHDIVNAVLFLEAAVQKNPDHLDAWLCLGITQSKNEQDGRAICALKKCIELDAKSLPAYLTLASCYANELLTNEALDSLYKWLINNEKYSGIFSLHLTANTQTRINDKVSFDELKDLFLQAISLSNSSNEIDSDLQICLGILFYLYNDYNKAAECFNTAVLTKPDDASLWNKLGAAVGNAGNNEKAVNAYYCALTLSPGYIRARYNLGISCLNLNAYKQAIEHFLLALKQQSNNIISGQMSDNIWQVLTIAIHRLNRSDLEQYLLYKDLPKLFREFNIE